MPRYLPICLDVSGRTCAVIGAGSVAARKITALLAANALVRVVAPDVSEPVRELAKRGQVQLDQRTYEPDDLHGAVLAFAATDRPDLNQQIARDAAVAGIPVNVADGLDGGSFILPAVMREGEMTIAVSTGGRSPTLAAFLRDEIQRWLPSDLPILMRDLADLRETIKCTIADPQERTRAWRAILAADLLGRAKASHGIDLNGLLSEALREHRSD